MDHPDTKTVTRYGVRFYLPHKPAPYVYYVGMCNDTIITTLKPEDVSTWSDLNDAYAVAKAIKPSLLPEGCECTSVFIVEEPAYND